jgi:rhodanese-related sulfurtransferase
VKATHLLLSAACALCLSLAGCKSDAQSTGDAAVTEDMDANAATDLPAPAVDVAGEVLAEASPAETPAYDVGGDAGCSGWTTLKHLSPAEVADLIATSNPIVINVHTPYAGDIPGTDTSIPFDHIKDIDTYLHGDKCADVVLVCWGGGMSQTAGTDLINLGYLRVRDLDGGMNAWQKAGYPLLMDGGT